MPQPRRPGPSRRIDQWIVLVIAAAVLLHATWQVGASLLRGSPVYSLPGMLPLDGLAGALLIACAMVLGAGLGLSALHNLRLLRP